MCTEAMEALLIMETIGARLTEARKRAGFKTAKDAALAMGVAISTYTQHELAHQFLPARKAATYAAHFRTDPAWLLYGHTTEGEAAPRGVPLLDAEGVEACLIPGPPHINPATNAYTVNENSGMDRAWWHWVVYFDGPADLDLLVHEQWLAVAAVRSSGATQGFTLSVGQVKAAGAAGRYHLLPPGGSPDLDVEVAWAARVTALCPPLGYNPEIA